MASTANDCWERLNLDPDAVRQWITAAVPDHDVSLSEPDVLNCKDWSIVARFCSCVNSGAADVVYKAILLPEFCCAPAIFTLLDQHCSGLVPRLLASRTTSGRADLLFAPFTGMLVEETGSFDALLEMARTVGRIQSRLSTVPSRQRLGVPLLPARDVPYLLDAVIGDIDSHYQTLWDAEGGAIRTEFGLPCDLLEQVAAYRPRLDHWADELERCGPPPSLDHVDCLPHNAVLQENGDALIFDWEQATWGCPLLSLDILLAFAQNFAETCAANENKCGSLILNGEQENDATRALRAAYLSALGWNASGKGGTNTEVERILDLALCLSPIRYAHAEGIMAAKFGNEHYHAEDLAWWIMRTLRRWERQTI